MSAFGGHELQNSLHSLLEMCHSAKRNSQGNRRRGNQSACLSASAWLLILSFGCSNSDLYATGNQEPLGPDRVALIGELCTEDTGGSDFPAKLLLVIDSSLEMFGADPGGQRFLGGRGSIDTILQRNRFQPHVRLGFIGSADFARAFPTPDGQRFFRPQDPEVLLALSQLQGPLGSGRDVVSALTQVQSFILNDLAESTPGEVLRSRYIVSMLFAGPPNPPVDPLEIGRQVEDIRDLVHERGGLEFRLNTNLLYYGPRTIDQGQNNFQCYPTGTPTDPLCPCSTTVTGTPDYCNVFCAVQSGAIDEARNDAARIAYEAMAFAGGGRFTEHPCPPNVDFNANAGTGAVQLVKKDIVAYNRNVVLTEDGPLVDSDGDGLADITEQTATPVTAIDNWDSDGDGIGDRVEFRTFPQQDPADPFDRPASCVDPVSLGVLPDRDLDLLNDCEEGLLQTSATIPDTDGDGLPDLLEFLSNTIPTSAEDRLLDFDTDGIQNAQEVLEHSNPRVNEGPVRGREAYRNDIVALGRRLVASLENPPELQGIAFRGASRQVVGGQAFIRWDPCTRTLEWSDARFLGGNPSFVPVPLVIDATGMHRLFAQVTDNGVIVEEIWADFFVTLELMPACDGGGDISAFPLISVSERSCYDVRISNIKVMQTEATIGQPQGMNSILIFFTQSPETRLDSPGITKVAEVKVQFLCTDPGNPLTCARSPEQTFINLSDEQFVSALP